MASIIQGADSEIIVSLDSELDLSSISWFEVRIVQSGLLITKGIEDINIDTENHSISIPISRDESFRFSATAANLQVYYRLGENSKTVGMCPVPFRIYPMISPASYYNEGVEGEEGENPDNTGENPDNTEDNTDNNTDSNVDSNTDSENSNSGD